MREDSRIRKDFPPSVLHFVADLNRESGEGATMVRFRPLR